MATGKVTTYDLSTGLYLDISPMIKILNPFDIPLQGGQGADGRSALAVGPNAFEKKIEWQDESLLTPVSTVSATATTGQGYIAVASGDQLRFSTGDIILVGAEYMRVTGYGSTTDTLTVTRAYSGSAATVATSDEVVGVGTALAEGSDPENARAVDRNNRYNYTQIFGPTAIQVSGTENVVRKYGLEGTGEFNHQVANRTKEHYVARDQALLYGVRAEDTNNKWRTMGGMSYWITTNNDSSTTSISEAAVLAQIQATWDVGGQIDTLLVGSTQKRKISAWTTNLQITEQLNTNSRGTTVDFFDTDFGRVSILLDRWCRASDAFGYSRDQAQIRTLRPFVYEQLAKTGDSIKGQILSEISFQFERQSHAFKMTALT